MSRYMMTCVVAMLVAPQTFRADVAQLRIPADACEVKLYVMVTPSHERYFNEWFLPTLQDKYELVVTRHEQTRAGGVYMRGGWTEAVLKKVDMIIQAIEDNWGTVFIYSDVDIQFFQPTWPTIAAHINDFDMLAQNHGKNNTEVCTGFFACIGNERTLRAWQAVRKRMRVVMEQGREVGDQKSFNFVMQRDPDMLTLGVLPRTFMNGGVFAGKWWKPGMSLSIPKGIVLHHANFVHSGDGRTHEEVKIAQLAYVRERVNASPELVSASAVGEVRPLKPILRSSKKGGSYPFNRSHSLRNSMARSKLSSSAASRI